MGYVYEEQKPHILTDEGQRDFLKVRDAAKRLLDKAGAFRMEEVFKESHFAGGDSWFRLACVDRLVELKELTELTEPGKVAGQYRVFVRRGEW